MNDYRHLLLPFYQALEKQWHHPLQKTMFNLCEVLLLQLLARFCLKKTDKLLLQETDLQRIHAMREHKEFFIKNLQQAFAQILQPYPKTMQTYFYPFAPQLCNRLMTQNLATCLIYDLPEDQGLMKVQVQMPQGCTRNQFLIHLEYLSNYTTKEKLTYLQDHIFSPYDIVDLFAHGVFQEEDFLSYLNQCSSLQLCILLHIMEPDLLSFYPKFTFQENLDDLMIDQPWQSVLLQYISSLQNSEQHQLEKMIASITIISA